MTLKEDLMVERRAARRKTMPVDIDDFKAMVDALDTKYGHDELVIGLVGTLDRMIETLENSGKIYRHRRRQTAGSSGYRNVSYSKHNKRFYGRLSWTDGTGKRIRKNTGYFHEAEQASIAVEELRTKLGLN